MLQHSEKMASSLSPAEHELLAIYTRQAYDAYLSENLRDTQARISQIEALNPGDIHALFLKGALVGRKARPGTDMRYIRTAIELWRPLFEQLTGEALTAMKAAIAEALSTILYIPVDLSSRQWDVYCDARTAIELSAVVRCLMQDEDFYRSFPSDAYASWVGEQFVANYVFLVDEIVGLNKPFPAGAPKDIAEAYESALSEVVRMADRIPEDDDSKNAVKQNARERLMRFREHCPQGTEHC